ncbi:glycosyltransferase family 2 protein [Microlunatus antarcticus]|uniref:Glycosyltransferase involved in cell wall biosynthesis n=1 Tax=Microlunatus antarcticus TaxID=53388 RepID=A0A7W5P5E6_9ACTN|nr:glycosyltransferase family 2 protein [Microlunatus antarcticus]MBB3325400.1 glycosyltransferase involved in cell wall biosynthesis [Microlunatus antarcticus]
MDDVVPGTPGAADGRLITVGIPVFNGRSLLRSCLHSVISSGLPRERFEILVADDGSREPETLAILADFSAKLAGEPGFFRVLSLGTNSGGAARPRNRILDEATGAYVFFIDSDDTIGSQALERIAEAVAAVEPDWVALHQVPVNGRAAGCTVRQTQVEVSRDKALSTLTVHKVFRRAEIERQHLRFDEELPSGQDISFAFSYLVNAQRFLMLGGYDYYYLTQHGGNPDEPVHLSRRASSPAALIEKNHRILTSMITDLTRSPLSEAERLRVVYDVLLPRVLLRQRYLASIANADPEVGAKALAELAGLLADPLLAGLDDAGLRKGFTPEHLAAIRDRDLPGLRRLMKQAGPAPKAPVGTAERWAGRARRVTDVVAGLASHRHVVEELAALRRSVRELQKAQERLEEELRTRG